MYGKCIFIGFGVGELGGFSSIGKMNLAQKCEFD